MVPDMAALLAGLGVVVALDLVSIGASYVNARLAQDASNDAKEARDTAKAVRAELRRLRGRVVQVETTQEHRTATDGGQDEEDSNGA
jgi:hypothetical protein